MSEKRSEESEYHHVRNADDTLILLHPRVQPIIPHAVRLVSSDQNPIQLTPISTGQIILPPINAPTERVVLPSIGVIKSLPFSMEKNTSLVEMARYTTLKISEIQSFAAEVVSRGCLAGFSRALGKNRYALCAALNKWDLFPENVGLYGDNEAGYVISMKLSQSNIRLKEFAAAMTEISDLRSFIKGILKVANLDNIVPGRGFVVLVKRNFSLLKDIREKCGLSFADPLFEDMIVAMSKSISKMEEIFHPYIHDRKLFSLMNPRQAIYYLLGLLYRAHLTISDFIKALDKSSTCRPHMEEIKTIFACLSSVYSEELLAKKNGEEKFVLTFKESKAYLTEKVYTAVTKQSNVAESVFHSEQIRPHYTTDAFHTMRSPLSMETKMQTQTAEDPMPHAAKQRDIGDLVKHLHAKGKYLMHS